MSATLEKPKPGLAAALLIPFVIWVVASIVAVVFLVMGIQRAEDVADDFARVPGGQAREVELTSAGSYRIWIDESTSVDSFSPSASATITGPNGDSIQADTYIGSLTYNDLEAVLTFEAPEAGTYTFEVVETSSFSDSGSSAEFAIGKGNPFSEVGVGLLLMFVIGGLGFVIALIIMIVMLVKRGRSKRRITQAAVQNGGYGGGYGAGPPGGYPPPGGYQQPGSSW